MGDFAAAGRMPDMNRIPEVEMVGQLGDIGRIMSMSLPVSVWVERPWPRRS